MVKRYNSKNMVFVELECAEQKVKVLKHKHFYLNENAYLILIILVKEHDTSFSYFTFHLHTPSKTRDSTRHENIRKLIHVIPGATDKIKDIVTKPLLPTPRNYSSINNSTHPLRTNMQSHKDKTVQYLHQRNNRTYNTRHYKQQSKVRTHLTKHSNQHTSQEARHQTHTNRNPTMHQSNHRPSQDIRNINAVSQNNNQSITLQKHPQSYA